MLIRVLRDARFHPTAEADGPTRPRRYRRGLVLLVALLSWQGPGRAAEHAGLVYVVENAAGETLASHAADQSINPASTIKIATSLWALERLGADHRFETRFDALGKVADGVLDGDLVVIGGADPDFHVENASLVATALNRAGIREVRGRLLVDHRFWIGWEGGSEKREADADRRALTMATRLRRALDPARWSDGTRKGMQEFFARRGRSAVDPPKVVVRGGVALHDGATSHDGATQAGDEARRPGAAAEHTLLVHRSNPLARILKRLNAYSNNDIERLGTTLGTARELAANLAERWEVPRSEIRIETLSGLGVNRLTPRDIVRLLRDLQAVCDRQRIPLDAILPRAGCDPGTLENYPRFGEGPWAGTIVAKTGTLKEIDGGVSVLTGRIETAAGQRLFCVAAPRSGHAVEAARRRHEDWLREKILATAAPGPGECGPPLAFSDEDAWVVRISSDASLGSGHRPDPAGAR